jgi:uncharacterized membrane protein
MEEQEQDFISIEDTPKNRLLQFNEHGVIYFNQIVSTKMLISTREPDKHTKVYTKYLSTIITGGTAAAGAAIGAGVGTVLGPLGTIVGATGGAVVDVLIKKGLKKKKKKQCEDANRIAQFFLGYDPYDEKCIHLLYNLFSEIFMNYNLQVNTQRARGL